MSEEKENKELADKAKNERLRILLNRCHQLTKEEKEELANLILEGVFSDEESFIDFNMLSQKELNNVEELFDEIFKRMKKGE